MAARGGGQLVAQDSGEPDLPGHQRQAGRLGPLLEPRWLGPGLLGEEGQGATRERGQPCPHTPEQHQPSRAPSQGSRGPL